GEPQHPIPPFVGPVIAAHLNDFGRYPANKGTDRFRAAAARWTARRYALPRPLDPDRDVLVLNGTREGLFLAAVAARRLRGGPPRPPALPDPKPFLGRHGAGRRARRVRAGLPAGDPGERLPARSRCPRRTAPPPHRGDLHGVAVEPAGRGGAPRLPRPAR